MDFGVTKAAIEEFYGGGDPREIPVYTIAEAARHIHTPYSTVYSWLRGQNYSSASGAKRSKPVVKNSDRRLSFYTLVELHLVRGLRQLHGVSMPKIRRSLDYARTSGLGTSLLELVQYGLKEGGGDLFVEHDGNLVSLSLSGQLALKKILEKYLNRIDLDDTNLPRRLYPFPSEALGSDRKTILIDPFVAFGQPTLANTGIPTDVIARRFDAGESLEYLAWDYDLDVDQLQDAILYEQAA